MGTGSQLLFLLQHCPTAGHAPSKSSSALWAIYLLQQVQPWLQLQVNEHTHQDRAGVSCQTQDFSHTEC